MVDRATTGGERAWSGMGDGRAQKFALLMVSEAVGKAVVDGWARATHPLMPLDVGRRMGEVWSALVGCRLSNEHVLLRPRSVAMV